MSATHASSPTGTEHHAALSDLIDSQAVGYAGDVLPAQAYSYLQAHRDAAMVDVRTQPEWQFIGLPDLSGIGHQPHLISWKNYPKFEQNQAFAVELAKVVPNQQTPVFFLCRSGGRSLDAAIYATSLGYRCCFNIAGGFEGEPDASGKRGTKSCWKSGALPWAQT